MQVCQNNIQVRRILVAVLLTMLMPMAAHAKRAVPSRVEPVIEGGIRYTAPTDSGRRAYVQAWDITTGKMLWDVTVFRKFFDPILEEDAQDVYIKTVALRGGKLVLVDERERTYTLDLKTRQIVESSTIERMLIGLWVVGSVLLAWFVRRGFYVYCGSVALAAPGIGYSMANHGLLEMGGIFQALCAGVYAWLLHCFFQAFKERRQRLKLLERSILKRQEDRF